MITLGNGETDNHAHLLNGSQGLGIAPPTFASSEVPGGDGSLLRGKRLGERDVFIPVYLEADTEAALDEHRADLIRLLSPTDPRDLFVRVQAPGSESYRELRVHYAGGLAGDFGSTYWGTFQTIGLEFRAFDAFWLGQPLSISQQVDPARKPFLSTTTPFFPIMLADSTVDAQIVLQIGGDSPTWPVWTITPPGEDLLISHTETGKRFYVDGLLAEPLVIDMENAEVRTLSGEDRWSSASMDSQPFMLQPGRNVLDFSMVGATADSLVHVTYRPRYLAGL